MRAADVGVRSLAAGDLEALGTFRCSTGVPWEDAVERQARGPLPRRYLASPPRFDGRMLLAWAPDGALLAVGAHHIEPTLVPGVGYTEVIALRWRLAASSCSSSPEPSSRLERSCS